MAGDLGSPGSPKKANVQKPKTSGKNSGAGGANNAAPRSTQMGGKRVGTVKGRDRGPC